MGSESQLQNDSLLEVLDSQIGVLLSVIARPVVLRQIFVVLLGILFAWFISRLIQHWWLQSQSSPTDQTDSRPTAIRFVTEALRELAAPLLTIVILTISIWVFDQLNYPKGLLEELINLLFIWLLYRIIVTLLNVRYGANARPYRNRIITPIFLILVLIQSVAAWPGTVALAQLSVTIGTTSLLIANLVTALIVFYVFIVSAWLVQQAMELTLPQRLNIESGVIESLSTLTRYSILAIGIVVTLSLLGLNFTSLAIVAGGLSVGIGIGLQDVVANFVSGLVLLFEQSLRPGDVIDLDGRITQVEKISLRATTVRTRTNEELIIPNASFTTQQISNLTKSDRLVQVIIPLGISYSCDPEMVRQLAIETSLNHPQVLSEPAPNLAFRAYGESSLDFNLLVSTTDPELTNKIRSDLYYMLWKVFAEHNITIPFPQRDLNPGAGWENLVATLKSRS